MAKVFKTLQEDTILESQAVYFTLKEKSAEPRLADLNSHDFCQILWMATSQNLKGDRGKRVRHIRGRAG